MNEFLFPNHRQQPLFENFQRRVLETPEDIAIWINGDSITFEELNSETVILAERLHATRKELGLDGVVPIFVTRSLKSAMSVFAVYYAGIPFTIIDEETPIHFAQSMLSSMNIHHHLWFPDGAEDLTMKEVLSVSDSRIEVPKADPEALSYVLLTSGSSGKPKGVMHSRNSTVLHRIKRFPNPVENKYKSLNATPFAFAVGLANLLLVSHGNSYYNVSPTRITPSEYFDLIHTIQPTHVALPSAIARIYGKAKATTTITSVKDIQIGGEAIRFEQLCAFAEFFSRDTKIRHSLGASEAISDFKYEQTPGNIPTSGQVTLVGNTEYAFLVPREEYGEEIYELYAGAALSLGYYNDNELTERKFVTIDGRRWWESGDLLQKVGDNLYLHYGRKDDVVKVSGHLVSPMTIANSLMSLDCVANAKVTSEKDNEKFLLHAYIELKEKEAVSLEQLRALLAEILPLHMIPQYFHIVDSMPLTKRGKTDLNSLKSQTKTH